MDKIVYHTVQEIVPGKLEKQVLERWLRTNGKSCDSLTSRVDKTLTSKKCLLSFSPTESKLSRELSTVVLRFKDRREGELVFVPRLSESKLWNELVR